MLTTHIRTRGLRPGVKGLARAAHVSILQPKLQLELVFPLWPKQFGARCIKTHKCRCRWKKVAFFIYTHIYMCVCNAKSLREYDKCHAPWGNATACIWASEIEFSPVLIK